MRTAYDALWINYETDEWKGYLSKYGNPCPYFRKQFSLKDKKVVSATLAASAIGVFKAYINGVEVDDDYMSPGFTDYRKRIPLIEYDVTDKLKKDNAVVIVAGDGWAVGNMGNKMLRCNYFPRIQIIAKLTVVYEDGEKQCVVTDGSWRACDGEIRRTDNYMGEYIDHRYALAREDYLFGSDDCKWRKVKVMTGTSHEQALLCAETAPRVKTMHVLSASEISGNERTRIYDFKQNFTGVIRLKAKGESGAKITVRHGEMLDGDGSLYTENLRKAEATDVFVLSGNGEEEFRPLFTFHGFRYAEITVTGKAEVLSVIGEAMYSSLDKTGEFECSDGDVNKLYSNIVWGQRSNFLSVPTDCPQRDERLGWTGDAQIFCGTAMYNMDCRGFYKKYVQDMIDAQLGDGAVGGIAPIVPHADGTFESGRTASAGWADAMAVLPYEYYLMYGDKKTLKYHLTFAKRHVEYCKMQSDELIRPVDVNYGDWLSVKSGRHDETHIAVAANSETDKDLLATEYFAYSALLVAKMCEIVGDDEASEYYELFENIKSAFRKRFLVGGKLVSHTQTAYLLAYAFSLMSADEVKSHLLDTVHSENDTLTTGFLGVKFLLPVLCELGESALAYKILTYRGYPGWLYSVVNGATTIWERWNGYTIEHGFGEVAMNSFNHYSLGSCGEWMFKYALGIVPELSGAGFKKLTLRPYVDLSGKITSMKGSYDSVMGKISVSWRVEDGVVYYDADVPAAIDLAFDIPDGVRVTVNRI